MAVTAKVRCHLKYVSGDGDNRTAVVFFGPDYANGRNAEWATASPSLSVQIMLNQHAANLFDQGTAYTLVFEPAED